MLTGKHGLFEQPLLCDEMEFFYSVCFAEFRKTNTIRKLEKISFEKMTLSPFLMCRLIYIYIFMYYVLCPRGYTGLHTTSNIYFEGRRPEKYMRVVYKPVCPSVSGI